MRQHLLRKQGEDGVGMRQIEDSVPVPAVADAEEIARLEAERDALRAELDPIKRKKAMLFDLSWGGFFLQVILLCFCELVVYRTASRGASPKPSG